MTSIISVQSFKGGTGKSTIAANMAVILAQMGKSVGVIDLDLEGPGLHVLFKVSPQEVKATINDVLQHTAHIRDTVIDLTERVNAPHGRLIFCPASHTLDVILSMINTGFDMSSFRRVLEDLAKEFNLEFVLIDSHPGVEKDTLLSMAVSDFVILISRVDHQDLFGSGVMTEVATRLDKPVILILNMIPGNVTDKESQRVGRRLSEMFHLRVLSALPFNSDVLENLSKSVFVLERPKDPLTQHLRDMAGRMLEAIAKSQSQETTLQDEPSRNPVAG